MIIREIVAGTWSIFAVCKADGTCPLLTFLEGHAQQNAVDGLLAIFEHCANDPKGPRLFNREVSKTLRDGICEFRKARLRILWFTDSNRVIICSHGFEKKSNKTPNSEIERAIRNKKNIPSSQIEKRNNGDPLMSKQNTGFQALFDRAKSSEQFWIEKTVLQFTEDLSAFLERKSISRAELARKADCAPSFITKVLRGNTNLNIKTMVKLARVVGAQVCVHLAPEDAKVSWNDESTSTVTIVNLDVPAETFKLNQVSHPAHVAFTQVSTEKTTVVHN